MTEPTHQQKHAMLYVARYETPEFGVILRAVTARALVSRGLAIDAPRRPFARIGGLCVRLTPEGKKWVNS